MGTGRTRPPRGAASRWDVTAVAGEKNHAMKSRGVVSKARTSSGRGRELETRLLGAAAVGRSDARLQDVVRSPPSRRGSATLQPARLVLGLEPMLMGSDVGAFVAIASTTSSSS